MLVKTKIKREWFQPFGKCKDKEYYDLYSYKLNIDEYICFRGFFENNFEFNIIEFLFPQIQMKNLVSPPLSETTFNDEDYKNGNFGIIYNGKINDFNRITTLEVEEYGIFESKDSNQYDDIYLTNFINHSSFQLHLNKFNMLNGEFSLIGSFKGEYIDYSTIDFNGDNFHAKIKCIGLLKNKDYPTWIEYIIDSMVNYKNQDLKMAILNLFSAFENFVTIIHDKFIFEYFAMKIGKNNNELKSLRDFAQNKKKLFDKAQDVIKFLELDDLKDTTLKAIKRYEKNRHSIAHGIAKNNDLESIDFQDMTFNIISFILTVSSNKNINTVDWKKIIKEI